jgi:hypothetical protein
MTGPRCYLIPELLERLQISRRQFEIKRASGEMPYIEELLPRIGRRPRYRADLVDAFLAGERRPLAWAVATRGRGRRSA